MTVVLVNEDELFVHSPIDLTVDLRAALDRLGRVRYVVPASNLHGHLAMGQYKAAYPDAELFAAPGLANRRSDLTFDHELGDRADPRWADEIDQAVFRGHRLHNEVVFFHRSSGSLIVGDICFNIPPDAPLLTRLWAWGPRMRPRVGPTPAFRLMVGDKPSIRASVERILGWDFLRIVVGHGEIVEDDSRAAFAAAWGRYSR